MRRDAANEAIILQARAEAPLHSLAEFAKVMWKEIEPRRPLIWGWHLDAMCGHLEGSYSGDIPILVTNIPPRCSKSSFFGVLGPAWKWLRDPQTQFLCITKAEKNATRDARLMRRVVRSPAYQRLRALTGTAWNILEDQDRVDYYANTQGGHRVSLTTGSDVTGAGADFLILDDVHDAEEVAVGTPERIARMMADTSTKYEEVWEPRLNPPRGAVQNIMQRLDPRDMSGYLIGKGARSLVLPMEYEAKHPDRWAGDPRSIPGQLLTPERMDEEFLSAKRDSARKWAGQYQQRPSPAEGGQFRVGWFKYEEVGLPSSYTEIAITVDAAVKGGATNDFGVIQVWGRRLANYYLLDQARGRWEYNELEDEFDKIVAKWPAAKVKLVEDKANGAVLLQRRRGRVSGLIAFDPSQTPGDDKGKAARAKYTEVAAEAGQIHIPDPKVCTFSSLWEQEHYSFPNGANDDQVDATSQLIMRWEVRADVLPTVASYSRG